MATRRAVDVSPITPTRGNPHAITSPIELPVRQTRDNLRHTAEGCLARLPGMKRAIALTAVAVLCLGGCRKSAYYTVSAQQDGVHVTANLTHVSEVTVAGHTLRSGQATVLPYSVFHMGDNRIQVDGAPAGYGSISFRLGPQTLAALGCKTEHGAMFRGDLGVSDKCAVQAGVFEVPLTLAKGVTAKLDEASAADGVLRLDLRPRLWSQPVPDSAVQWIRGPQWDHNVTLSWGNQTWKGRVTFDASTIDLLDSVVRGFPDSAKGRTASKPRTLAAFRAGGYWHFLGHGSTLGDVDLFAISVSQGTPAPFAHPCHFDSVNGFTGYKSLSVTAIPETFAAYDASGKEVARKTFTPTQCPTSASLEKGQTTLSVVPGSGMVGGWIKTLLH